MPSRFVFPKEMVPPGVPPDLAWRLLNVSNLTYYALVVEALRAGKCEFCQIDPDVNTVLPESNDDWIAIRNNIAPRGEGRQSAQARQYVIPLRGEHTMSLGSISVARLESLQNLIRALAIGDGRDVSIRRSVILLRVGHHSRHAGSVPHLHVNVHVPKTGMRTCGPEVYGGPKVEFHEHLVPSMFSSSFVDLDSGSLCGLLNALHSKIRPFNGGVVIIWPPTDKRLITAEVIVPAGDQRVEVQIFPSTEEYEGVSATIAKSDTDLIKKFDVIRVFEKMRQFAEQGMEFYSDGRGHFDESNGVLAHLNPTELALVNGKLGDLKLMPYKPVPA